MAGRTTNRFTHDRAAINVPSVKIATMAGEMGGIIAGPLRVIGTVEDPAPGPIGNGHEPAGARTSWPRRNWTWAALMRRPFAYAALERCHRRGRASRAARRPEDGSAQDRRYYYFPGWHEPGTTLDFGFNKKAYEALPVDLRRMLDHSLSDSHSKNAIALKRLNTEFEGTVEVLPLPTPVLRHLKKLAAEVVRRS